MIGVNDPRAVKRWSASVADMVDRGSRFIDFFTRGTLRLPKMGDCEVQEELKHHGSMFAVLLTYRVNDGPTFRGAAITETRRWLPSESLRMRRELAREALAGLRAQVQAHLDVVYPIDNGPDDRVAYAEAITRLRLAHVTVFEDARRGGPIDDIGAAISRIAALPIPQSNDQ